MYAYLDTEGCWSMVGKNAEYEVTNFREPTMVLSLKGHTKALQRSLVIHEFGHALGLDHEHQRSDFWDAVEECFDEDKMKKDPRVNRPSQSGCVSGFERDWFAKVSNPLLVGDGKYDSESIMHYK